MSKIILYSVHCPRCNVLQKKLKDAEVSFEICTDVNTMKERGLYSSPMLEVDGELMPFEKAVAWVKGIK